MLPRRALCCPGLQVAAVLTLAAQRAEQDRNALAAQLTSSMAAANTLQVGRRAGCSARARQRLAHPLRGVRCLRRHARYRGHAKA